MVEFFSGVAWASLLITRIHPWVVEESNILRIPATVHNAEWMNDCQIHHGSFKAIRILDSVDVERHTLTRHDLITVYNDMFDHMDGVMWALATKPTQWKEDLYLAVNIAQQKLSKYYTEVTKMNGLLLISAHILDSFWKFWLVKKCDNVMDMNPEDETSFTIQYQEACLQYVEREYCSKHRWMFVIQPENVPHSNIFLSAEVSGFGQSSFDSYNLSSDDKVQLTPRSMAVMTPGQGDHSARLLTAARLYLNSPHKVPKDWGQIDPNLNYYHSNPMEISSTFWLPDIAD